MPNVEKSENIQNPEITERLADPAEIKLAADSALDLSVDDQEKQTAQLQQEVETFLADSNFSYENFGVSTPTEIMQRERGGARAARAFIQSRRSNEDTPAIVKLADELYLRRSGRKSQRSARSNEYLQTLLDSCRDETAPSLGESSASKHSGLNGATDTDSPNIDPASGDSTPAIRLTATTENDDSTNNGVNTPAESPGNVSVASPAPSAAIRIRNPNQVSSKRLAETDAPVDDEFMEDYLRQSQIIKQLRSELSALRERKDSFSKRLTENKRLELEEAENSFFDKFFQGIDRQDRSAIGTREKELLELAEVTKRRKEEELGQLRKTATNAGKILDKLIARYRAETDPAKADALWSQLEQARTQYEETSANFNLKNDVFSGLVGTPLFDAMGPTTVIVKANVRSAERLGTEDAEYLHIPPTSPDKKAAAKAAKEAAKAQHKHDIGTLKNAVKKIPDWFRPIDNSDDAEPGTSKSSSDREKQWNKLLKSFRDESRKYAKHERGDALGSVYQIACQMELKWRGRDNFDSLTVADKEEYQKDMDRLLHDHDGFAWKVLGSNRINGRDLSISDLYHVISRAEFKNTLRESRKRELGGVALMFTAAPTSLYQTSIALLAGVVPQVDNLYWFINATSRQHTINSLSSRTAKGLGLDAKPIDAAAA